MVFPVASIKRPGAQSNTHDKTFPDECAIASLNLKFYMRSAINYRSFGQITIDRQAVCTKPELPPVEEYLKWKESYSKSAHKAYKIWVERFQRFVGKNPEKLVLQDIVDFSASISPHFASKNIQFGMSIVRNYLKFFHEQGRLSLPLYLVKIPRATSNSHHAITEDEYQKMLVVLNGKQPIPLQNLCIIRLLNDTGMRVGELCSLTLEDIGSEKSAIIHTEKTTKKRRIFWSESTDVLLKLFRNLRGEVKLERETNALFIGFRGKYTGRITTRSIERMIKSIAQDAGIQNKICPHSFRHGFIHRLAKKKVTDAVIAQMVGHSTPHTVSEYTKLSKVELEETYREILEGN